MTTRFFLDTEFIDDGKSIDLISIGMAALSDECIPVGTIYAVSSEFDPERADKWVKENVLAKLPPATVRIDRATIKRLLLTWIGQFAPPYEFWAYFADYDWVVFCQLFGRMIDLPRGLPQCCMDLKQEMIRFGITRKQLPENKGEHDALADAIWVRDSWLALRDYAVRNGASFIGI